MGIIRLLRTDNENPDFIKLVRRLDAELAVMDGDDHPFYDQFNKIKKIKHVVVAYEDEQAVSCGAIKVYEQGTVEAKRMFTLKQSRGRGIAGRVLSDMELWALELLYERCILETGINQQEAIGFYKKNGYSRIPNYGQYAGVENNLCFEERLYNIWLG